MSEATTGVAQANARVSTMPKLSPPSDGATNAFADAKLLGELVLAQEAEHVDPVVDETLSRVMQEPHSKRVGARISAAARLSGGGSRARRGAARAAPCVARAGR